MANITVDQFRARLPEFTVEVVADPILEVRIEDSALCIEESAFGQKWPLAQTYYVAHNLALDGLTADSAEAGAASLNPVSSETEGDTSVSYAVASTDGLTTADALLSSTLYGQRYLAIRNDSVVAGLSTGTGRG